MWRNMDNGRGVKGILKIIEYSVVCDKGKRIEFKIQGKIRVIYEGIKNRNSDYLGLMWVYKE